MGTIEHIAMQQLSAGLETEHERNGRTNMYIPKEKV
jgi:hypothetical protein